MGSITLKKVKIISYRIIVADADASDADKYSSLSVLITHSALVIKLMFQN